MHFSILKRTFLPLAIALIAFSATGCKHDKAVDNAQQEQVTAQTGKQTSKRPLTQIIPEAPDPVRFVNDFANVLQCDDSLENVLANLASDPNKRASELVQIVVVTINNLAGYEPGEYATALGNKWGVGSEERDNGMVILVKPKTEQSAGQVFIATGNGIEPIISDESVQRIIQEKMIPNFKEGNYDAAVAQAVNEIASFLERKNSTISHQR